MAIPAPKRDCFCHCHGCTKGCQCPVSGGCCTPCLCSPEFGLPENHDERCPKYKPAPTPIDDQAEEIKELKLKIDELKAQLEEKDKVISELKALVNDIGPGGQYDPR